MLKKLIKIPYYLLIAGVAAMGLLLIATLMPIPGNFKVKIVRSGSMEPAIRTGGIVVIRPQAANFKVGDVITFGPDTKTQVPTTHRIVEEKGEGTEKVFTTKGDANDTADPAPVRLSDVDGKVVLSLPYLGFILNFARQPLGFLLLVGIPAMLVIFDEMAKIWREIKRMRLKKILPEEKKYAGINVLDLRLKQRNISLEKPASKNILRFHMEALSAFLLIFVPLVGLSSVSSTVSYYNEKESSIGNTLRRGELITAGPAKEVAEPVADANPEDPPIPEEESLTTDQESPLKGEEPLVPGEEQPKTEEKPEVSSPAEIQPDTAQEPAL